MSRQPCSRIAPRNEALLERIRVRKAEPPFWGYRRSWAYLRFVDPRPVHKKRIRRLMQEHHLLVTPHRRLKAKRTPMRSKPTPTRPNEWWGIDRTKVLVQDVVGGSSVVVRDW
jgi:hypothetical protein